MIEERKDVRIQLVSGRMFPLLDPSVEDVRIEDIARGLAYTCRFSGHTQQFYSVAQHSVMVSYWCAPEDALYGLLHDASEAYLVDLPSPLKHGCEVGELFTAIEQSLQTTIYVAFGLSDNVPRSVEQADKWMLAAEARDLMGDPEWAKKYRAMVSPPLERVPALVPWGLEDAETEFLLRFYRLVVRVTDWANVMAAGDPMPNWLQRLREE